MDVKKKRYLYLKEWIDALRSGKYEQGTYELHVTVGGKEYFCCLGVACHIFSERENIKISSIDESTYYNYNVSCLPSDLSKILGIDEYGTLRKSVGNCRSLTELNDETYLTFNEIADVIEQQFLIPAEEKYTNVEIQ